jgi:DNA-binding transcriptional regulator WhiA
LNCSANKNQSDGIDFLVVEQERVNQLDNAINCDISKDGISKSIRKLEQMTRLFSDFKR